MRLVLNNSTLVFSTAKKPEVITYKSILASSNEMQAENESTLTALIKIPSNADFNIVSANNTCIIAFLSGAPDSPVYGTNISNKYASSSSVVGRKVLFQGDKVNGNVGDSEYLLVSVKNNGSWLPSELLINGIDYLQYITE